MIPEKIGRYEIKSELGRGGMATVYKALDPSSGREVAVKVLPREFLHDPQFRARFETEIKTVAQLEHPAIVPIYDVGEEDGQPYFVMRNMTGGSLSDWLKQGAFSPQDTARIVERLAKALAYAHKRGIIHRDLKPGNVLFDSNGDPFLSDFGVAKLAESAQGITGSGVIGTPAYMSPEQAQSGQVDNRSDIYAMGAIIYELLTGQQPYRADTPMGVVIKHITDPVPDILRDNPNLAPELDVVIRTAMDKDKEKRYPTIIELAKALNKAAFGEEGHVVSDSSTLTVRPRDPNMTGELTMTSPSKKSGMWVVAGAVVLVLIVAGVFLFRGTPATSAVTEAPLVATSAAVFSPVPPTNIPPTTIPVTATNAISITPSLLPPLPVFPGGADRMALISAKEIWVMNMDGSQARAVTSTGSPKTNLQWLPDGKSMVFITDKCVYKADAENGQVEEVACFPDASFFEGFQVSPDGARVAISIDRQLIIAPFDLAQLAGANTRSKLIKIPGACVYTQSAVRDVRWSRDGLRTAFIFVDVTNRTTDALRVLDITNCPGSTVLVDEFPAGKFTISGLQNNPILPSFDWDGNAFFLFNDFVRNSGYGNLYFYDMNTRTGGLLNPIDNSCCYRDARLSPDGKFVLFLYQDARLGEKAQILLYYVPLDKLRAGEVGQPIAVPLGIFSNVKEAPVPALHAVPPPP